MQFALIGNTPRTTARVSFGPLSPECGGLIVVVVLVSSFVSIRYDLGLGEDRTEAVTRSRAKMTYKKI
jgi:hypothetical protein